MTHLDRLQNVMHNAVAQPAEDAPLLHTLGPVRGCTAASAARLGHTQTGREFASMSAWPTIACTATWWSFRVQGR